MKITAKTVTENLRRGDLYGRYGGEEFIIVLPETDRENAEKVAEKIRGAIENQEVKWNNQLLKVTSSFGIYLSQKGTEDTVEDLISKADQALYGAKEKGRNCVV
ncbi:MAG: GGDEF domain-containing protein, partial [SAR324 cluster bacterium]|nr:GGDEF domain-containing protein [SAR324 cluster bacterium]